MSELLTSVPGDIPGLLLRGSPVLVVVDSDLLAVRGVVLDPFIEPGEADPRCLVWNECNGRDNKAQMFVSLDLTDATGRAHAAWWVAEQVDRTAAGARSALTGIEFRAWEDATQNRSMTALAIDTLARLVLRLAGRS